MVPTSGRFSCRCLGSDLGYQKKARQPPPARSEPLLETKYLQPSSASQWIASIGCLQRTALNSRLLGMPYHEVGRSMSANHCALDRRRQAGVGPIPRQNEIREACSRPRPQVVALDSVRESRIALLHNRAVNKLRLARGRNDLSELSHSPFDKLLSWPARILARCAQH